MSDPEFWTITLRTVLFTASVVAGTVLLGVLIALLMRHLSGPMTREQSEEQVARFVRHWE